MFAGFAALGASWFDRSYNHDDFYTGYLAWLRTSPLQPGVDYDVPNFTLLADLAAPFFHWYPESFIPFLIGKSVMLFVAVALVAATGYVTRLLGASLQTAALSAVLLLWQPTFIQRISDIRADQIGALLILASIAGMITKRYSVAGVIFGGSVAISYKLAIAGPFLLIALLFATGETRWRSSLRFLLGAAILPAIYVIWRLIADGPTLAAQIFEQILTGVGSGVTIRSETFIDLFQESPALILALLIGTIVMILPGGYSVSRLQRGYALSVLGFLALFIVLNPMIFPYNLVILLPLVLPFLAGVERLVDSVRWKGARALFVVSFTVVAVTGGAATMIEPTPGDRKAQETAIRWVWRALEPQEHAFDWQGMHVGRPGVYHWWMYSGMIREYQSGNWYDLTTEWQTAQVKLILYNYRLNWMRAEDHQFLQSHFVWIDHCILVPGWSFNRIKAFEGIEFEAFLREGEYRWLPSRPEGVEIDGEEATDVEHLTAGIHRLRATTDLTTAPDSFYLVHLDPSALEIPPPCPDGPLVGGF